MKLRMSRAKLAQEQDSLVFNAGSLHISTRWLGILYAAQTGPKLALRWLRSGLTVFTSISSRGYWSYMEILLLSQDKGFFKNSDKPNYSLWLDYLLSSQLDLYENKVRSLENIGKTLSWATGTQLESLRPSWKSDQLSPIPRIHTGGESRLQQTVPWPSYSQHAALIFKLLVQMPASHSAGNSSYPCIN